jgi:Pup-ligase protein
MLVDRTFGSELEYGISVAMQDGARLEPPAYSTVSYALRQLDLPCSGEHTPVGRLYVDHDHPEGCTNETTSIDEWLANSLALDRLMPRAFDAAVATNAISRYVLHRRVADHSGKFWGGHISLETRRKYIDPQEAQGAHARKFETLAYALATMNIITGAGAMQRDETSDRYRPAIAQKAPGLTVDFSTETTSVKPLVNLRDEPLGGYQYSRIDKNADVRLHITSQDASNMSPWASRMLIGMLSLTVGMMEEGILLDEWISFAKGSWHKVAKQVALDPSCTALLELEDGRTIRAVDIQYELMANAHGLLARDGMSQQLYEVLKEWERSVDLLRQDPQLLHDRGDWHLWYRLQRRYVEKLGGRRDAKGRTGWQHADIQARDLQWSQLSTADHQKYVGQYLRQRQWSKWMPPEDLVQRAMRHALSGRALVREQALRYLARTGKSGRVDWDRIVFYDSDRALILSDPRKSYNLDLERIMRRGES